MNIKLQNIKIPLGETLSLNIPKWDLKHGEHILIRGRSGQGKTSFLHLLSGLILPAAGQVQIGDKILGDISEGERTHLRRSSFGLVFQRLNLIEHLNVFENIALGFYPDSPNLDLVMKTLEILKLTSKIGTRCSVLSLGEQQRVAVARAVIHNPAILLADEPTSSLDDYNTKLVVEVLLKAATGKTLIVVSHDHRLDSYFDHRIDFQELVAP